MKGLEGKIDKQQLSSLGLFSPEKKRLRGDLMVACSFLMKGAEGQMLISSLW